MNTFYESLCHRFACFMDLGKQLAALTQCAKPAPNLSTATDALGRFSFLRHFVKIAPELALLVRTVAERLVVRVATST
jgi:hypothetical protein